MKTIIVYDFETSSPDPYTCQPVQLAALPIDANRLTYDKKNHFVSMIRPSDFDNLNEDTLKWHAKIKNCSEEEILESWKAAPEAKTVWQNFLNYINKFNPKNTKFTAPVSAGHNIVRFDSIILERLRLEHSPKQEHIFHPRDYIDTLNLSFLWFESLSEPKSYSMDNLRNFFGYNEESQQNAHEALSDCVDSAELVIRFLKLHRKVAPNVKFRNALTCT